MTRFDRRRFAQLAARGAALPLLGRGRALAQAASPATERRYLIVLGLTGGASIIDSLLALEADEVRAAGGDPDRLNCFSMQQLVRVDGTPFRAVDLEHTLPALGDYRIQTRQSEFVKKHAAHTLVVAQEVTSVNHAVAETRAITGAGAWQGRTLQECVAAQYGAGLAVPNLDMAPLGFRHASGVADLPADAAPTKVDDPLHWALTLSASRGATHGIAPATLAAARRLRDERLDAGGRFLASFGKHPSVRKWLEDRGAGAERLEAASLVERLLLTRERPADAPVDAELVRLFEVFPSFEKDELEAQAMLCYLAITRGISCAVTFGPSFAAAGSSLGDIRNPPLAFDFSHQDHRGAQAMMWQRAMSVLDRLITLLQAKELEGGGGASYWDRTLVYLATDFGRDKTRAPGAVVFPTGHHLNNGSVLLSPLLRGNAVLGGVDAKTGLTYGFDLATGAPAPGTTIGERELFAGTLQALGVDTTEAGLPDVRAMRRS